MTLPRLPYSRVARYYCAAAAAIALAGYSQAASVTWDASGANPTAPTDGGGFWSTSNVNWAGGGVDSAWNNGANNDAVIGSSNGAAGTVNLTTNISANSLVIKGATSGNYIVTSTNGSILTLASGTVNNSITATISATIGGSNGLTKTGAGTLVLSSTNSYTGTTTILQGTVQPRSTGAIAASSVLVLGTAGASSAATLDTRVNVTVAGLAAAGTNPAVNVISTNTFFTGTAVITVNPDGAGGAAEDSSFAGVIKDGNATSVTALTKAGSHTLTLTGTNTYTGNTTVTAGTLVVNGALSGSSAVSVGSAGRLGGTGSLGNVSVSGTFAPGNSIGTISTGDLTINSGGALDNELGRSGVTPVSDRADVTGTVSLASGANLQLTIYSGLNNPVNGDIFFLVNNDLSDAVIGVFTKLNGVTTTLTEGSFFSFNSQSYEITYQANFGTSSFTGGNDIAIQVVPEPATCALFGLGATAVLLLRRRRTS